MTIKYVKTKHIKGECRNFEEVNFTAQSRHHLRYFVFFQCAKWSIFNQQIVLYKS